MGSRALGIRAQPGKPGKPGSIRKPGGFKSGDRALLEIRKYQKDGGYLIPKRAFWRLVREICGGLAGEAKNYRWEVAAMEALQLAAETHITVRMTGRAASYFLAPDFMIM